MEKYIIYLSVVVTILLVLQTAVVAVLGISVVALVRRVEELVGCPVTLLSTSPEREDTILMQNPFEQ